MNKLKTLRAWVLITLTFYIIAFGTGCTSLGMPIVTEKDKFEAVVAQYLPEGVKLEVYTAYDLSKEHGRSIVGITECEAWVIRINCTIKTIPNAEVFLHEVCHYKERGWHGSRGHSGLMGCEYFNYDTLNELKS